MNCKICGNESNNRVHQARELMLGLRDSFEYIECADCGCLFLREMPQNLSTYYPSDYLCWRDLHLSPVQQMLRSIYQRASLRSSPVIKALIPKSSRRLDLQAVAKMHLHQTARILDVGCGAGLLVQDLKTAGFRGAVGIDPYSQNGNAVVRKQALHEIEGRWDVIMLHHSFEHMPLPREALMKIASLLEEQGTCLIRIPIKNEAWKLYGTNWCQLDAPRHCFIHTFRSIEKLAAQTGLTVSSSYCDSNEYQFWLSELYAKGVSAMEAIKNGPHHYFSKKVLRSFRRRARELNVARLGDSAVFYLSLAPR